MKLLNLMLFHTLVMKTLQQPQVSFVEQVGNITDVGFILEQRRTKQIKTGTRGCWDKSLYLSHDGL